MFEPRTSGNDYFLSQTVGLKTLFHILQKFYEEIIRAQVLEHLTVPSTQLQSQ